MTKWRDDLPEKLPDMFNNGESMVEVCVELDITTATFQDWCSKRPEFKAAYEIGKERALAWWMRLGRAGCTGKVKVNTALYMIQMRNRFGFKDAQTPDTPDALEHKVDKVEIEIVPPKNILPLKPAVNSDNGNT